MSDEYDPFKNLSEEEIAGMNNESAEDADAEEDDPIPMTEEELESTEEYKNLDENQKRGLRGIRSRVKGAMTNGQAKASVNFLQRWSELSGCPGDYDHIDFENPYIALEYAMCDPTTLMRLSSPRHRDATLARFPEAVQKVFYERGPGNSKRYCDTILTPGMVKKGARTQLKAERKLAKRHSSLSAEEKERYKQLKAEQKEINKQRNKQARENKKKKRR